MASHREYLEFVLEQLSDIEGISFRPMMGEYILYCNDKIFGSICDDRFLVKITHSSKALMPEAEEQTPYDGAKSMLLVTGIDDRVFLKKLIEKLCEELPEKKKRI